MTAEQYIKENKHILVKLFTQEDLEYFMINFSKLKVQEALEIAGEKAIEIQRTDNRKYVSKKAIINSYNLEDIK